MTRRRKVGVAGAIVGSASAGTAAAVALKRYAVGRIRLRPDAEAGEPLGELPGRPATVTTDDGVQLYAEVDGPERSPRALLAPLTVVFVHGFCLNLDSWHYQRAALRDDHRIVLYDQRCHGRSARTDLDDCAIDRLGDDLAHVIEQLVPGPCVLVGHSMGGMAIMALADRHPELFGRTVRGVGLINTSAGKVAEITLGLPIAAAKMVHRLVRPTVSVLGRRAALVERTRHAGRDLMFLSLRRLGFGDPMSISPTVVDFVETMIRSTPIDVIAGFYPALMDHEKLTALDTLSNGRGVATTIIAGERDWLTPVEHSRAMAEAVPKSVLVEIPDSGHLVCLERPEAVNIALQDLLERAGRRRLFGKRTA